MQVWFEISRGATLHNLRLLSGLVGAKRLVAVLKSNAYGHGLEQVYDILRDSGVGWIGTHTLGEGSFLRDRGYQGRVLVMGPTLTEDFQVASKLNLDLVLGTAAQIVAADKAATLKVHMKVDTGMSRLGLHPEEVGSALRLLTRPASTIAGVCTHFANVEDVMNQEYADLQLDRFGRAWKEVESVLGSKIAKALVRHAAASASAMILPASRFDLCRIGISLYGYWPSAATRLSAFQQEYFRKAGPAFDLRPALTWYARVAQVKSLPAGTFVGYGCSYRTTALTRVAVLPVGYYEGYPRIAGESQSYVLLRGRRCPILGRICMNMMMVDVTHVPDAGSGDIATLLGTSDGEVLTADNLADWSRSISYEVLSRLHPQIPRVVVE